MKDPTGHDAKNLEEVLDQIEWSADTDHQQIKVEEIVSAVGTRSFAPLLVLVGIMIASPLSGIPLFPSLTAIIVLLISAQMLIGKKHFWLPAWLLRRTVPQDKMTTAVKWLRPPARFVDHLIKPRLVVLVQGPVTSRVIAILSLVIAAVMPLLEFIPFSSSLAGAVLAAFGLALISRDGLLALFAYIAAAATLWFGFSSFIL